MTRRKTKPHHDFPRTTSVVIVFTLKFERHGVGFENVQGLCQQHFLYAYFCKT